MPAKKKKTQLKKVERGYVELKLYLCLYSSKSIGLNTDELDINSGLLLLLFPRRYL